MCGFAGFVTKNPARSSLETALKMGQAIRHRGPDSSGEWGDPESGVFLASRRLAILDLSPEAEMPMHSADGRWVVVYNGEIYNFEELKNELKSEGIAFRGHSDTEVLLASVVRWGVRGALGRFNGMFGFALWDRAEGDLYLARDRFGEKPVYYGWNAGEFFFGSELKAFCAHPEFRPDVDRDSLSLYMRLSYIPAPFSIYKGISKLEPGKFLKLGLGVGSEEPKVESYWSAWESCVHGGSDSSVKSESEWTHETERLLLDSVRLRMRSDVPLGAFLSGGVDSSLIVALMQEQSTQPIRTFTMGFTESEYNEAEDARAVAAHLGTRHTELYVTPVEAQGVIPILPMLYDEPFADSSQIPTYLVSKLAREHVTVSLSGDAGDEVFGGYNRYLWAKKVFDRIERMPRMVRKLAKLGIHSLDSGAWNRLFQALDPVLPPSFRQRLPGDKLYKLSEALLLPTAQDLYLSLISHWKNPSDIVLGSKEPMTLHRDFGRWPKELDFTAQMMLIDLLTYLPDDILTKVDRATMGMSLEGRAPFLDHRLVELAWKLPPALKIRRGKGKWVLRQILARRVPQELMERPKMGFGIPVDTWIRGPLREWAESLLNEDMLRKDGWFFPEPIRKAWKEHLSGQQNHLSLLWNVLMFQSWKKAT